MTTIQDLPNELLLRLASHLSVLECFRLAKCAVRFRQVLLGYRALGCRLYAEAFPPNQSENELLRWLLVTANDVTASPMLDIHNVTSSSSSLSSLPTSMVASNRMALLHQMDKSATLTSNDDVDNDADGNGHNDLSNKTEYMEWNMDIEHDWTSEALPYGVMRDHVNWWSLLQRRGNLELRWRTLSHERLPLPTLPNLSGNEDILVLCARPWGTLLAINEEHSRLFWLPKSAIATRLTEESSTKSSSRQRHHTKEQYSSGASTSSWHDTELFDTTSMYDGASTQSEITTKRDHVHFPYYYDNIDATYPDTSIDNDNETIDDHTSVIVPDIDVVAEDELLFDTSKCMNDNNDDDDNDNEVNDDNDDDSHSASSIKSASHHIDIHGSTCNTTDTTESLFYTIPGIATASTLPSSSSSTLAATTSSTTGTLSTSSTYHQHQHHSHLFGESSIELDLGGAQLNFHRGCEVNEQYIVHVSWIPVVRRTSVHVWRIGSPKIWLVLATASQCWITGLRGDWLVIRQQEPNEDGDRLCMVNLRTRTCHTPTMVPVDASRHLHHAVRDAATLFVCCTTGNTAEPSEHSSGGMIAEWYLWQTPRSFINQHEHQYHQYQQHQPRSNMKMVDLRSLPATRSFNDDINDALPDGTRALTRVRSGRFVLDGVWPNFIAQHVMLFAKSTRIDDAHVLLRLGPGIGHDDTHVGVLSLKDTGKLLWIRNVLYSGVEIMPGQDLLLAWAYESGVHQLYQLSTGIHLRSYFGRRWYPVYTVMSSICIATVPSDVQLMFALMDMTKDIPNHYHQHQQHRDYNRDANDDITNHNNSSSNSSSDNNSVGNTSHFHSSFSKDSKEAGIPLPILLEANNYLHTIPKGVIGQLGKSGQLLEAVCATYCCVKDQTGLWLLDFSASDTSSI
ncbi:hypothetical protein BDF22DRAFT_745368 [Syncephalis plumigaleata]|nr:hypothetical protein BDF22DRAFT_745368 [Syncephalis plumigaleata]